MEKLRDLIKRHKERVILIGVALSFLFFIAGGLLLQHFNSRGDTELDTPPTKVELEVKKDSSPENSGKKEDTKTDTFYFEPSPGKLVKTLQEMKNLRPDIVQKKMQSLRVIWPVYFFEIRSDEKESVAYFDVSEDGFGVVVRVPFSPDKFPELQKLEPGKRLWLGGEIAGVDLSGTGSVQMKLEHVDFSQDMPKSIPVDQVEKKK